MSYTALLKQLWGSIYDSNMDVTSTINKYFHPKYEQCINGVGMNRENYIAHVIEQKKNIKINTIEYKYIVENGNQVFALYYPKGVNLNDSAIEAEVIAYFQFEKMQLLKIHGQVRLIKGDFSDADMQD